MLLKLKGKIVERYRTQSRFAVCCGKPENWISRIITNRDKPTEQDINIFRVKLKIPGSEIDSYLVNDENG